MPIYMRRYIVRLTSFMAGYGVALVCGLMLARGGAPEGVRVAFALLTASMICGVFWTIFRLLSECDDEYQRLLLIRQVLFSTAGTLAIVTFWQFLAVFDVIREGPQWVGALWLAMFGLAAPVARWRA